MREAGRAGLETANLLTPFHHRISPTPAIDGTSEPQSCPCTCTRAISPRLLYSRPNFGRSGIHVHTLIAKVITNQGLADEFRRCTGGRRAAAGARASERIESKFTRRMQRR